MYQLVCTDRRPANDSARNVPGLVVPCMAAASVKSVGLQQSHGACIPPSYRQLISMQNATDLKKSYTTVGILPTGNIDLMPLLTATSQQCY